MNTIDLETLNRRKTWREQNLDIYISLKNKYVYFMICKAASSTITYHLRFAEYHGTQFEVSGVNDVKQSPLLLPFQLDGDHFIDVLNSGEYKKISFVRNPYSRLLSCYLHRIIGERKMNPSKRALYVAAPHLKGKTIEFADFVAAVCDQEPSDMERHWSVQHEALLYDGIHYDFIGKQENLGADLLALEQLIYPETRFDHSKIESVNLAPKRTGATTKIGEFYTDQLMAKVLDRYRLDFSSFGYDEDLPRS